MCSIFSKIKSDCYISYPDEHEEQECQEVFVYLLDNAEPYGDRITTLINEEFSNKWFKMNWIES